MQEKWTISIDKALKEKLVEHCNKHKPRLVASYIIEMLIEDYLDKVNKAKKNTN